jgi:hypothetical protein
MSRTYRSKMMRIENDVADIGENAGDYVHPARAHHR